MAVKGYEIHCGESQYLTSSDAAKGAPLRLNNELTYDEQAEKSFADGCLSEDGQVLGTYLHGLFDSPEACQLILRWAGLEDAQAIDINEIREQQLNRLADVLAEHLDLPQLQAILTASVKP